jgi:hypothetical protein
LLVVRSIWLERNARVFNQKYTPAQVSLRLVLDEWEAWFNYLKVRDFARWSILIR